MERKEILKIFADNLRAERARKYYSQEHLAEKADITQEYLSRIETEKSFPSLVTAVKLSLGLNVTIDKLLPLDKYIKE